MNAKIRRRQQLALVARVVLAAALVPACVWGAATTVREPAFGLPHFYADSDVELARENGREIAKDRLGQLILLGRVGRGTLYQAFGLLDPSTVSDDIEARQTAYTSSELNNMFAKMPARERDLILAYCEGVNDTIDAVYAGTLPVPIEVGVLKNDLGLGNDLFGNATNISDQVDPYYRAPGGADPERANGGFQFTPEIAMAIGVLEVRNFGLQGFSEDRLLSELQALIAKFGATTGTEIWDDRNFLNDPLAPVSVPDPTTPGFGGPLAAARGATRHAARGGGFPRYDYAESARERQVRQEERAEFAQRLGAWPKIGSYAWVIGGGKTASGYPWLGGFPQTGIQTPSIMHFAENRSGEGGDHRIQGIGMEFAGAPLLLIGHTDSVAYTTTTAQLRVIDTFFEQLVGEDTDAVRYSDEGTPAPLVQRTETFLGGAAPTVTRVFWRSRARGGNGGSRAVVDFLGDAEGTAASATANSLAGPAVFGSAFNNGHIAIVDGRGAGQMRAIASATSTTVTLSTAWTTVPNNTSVFVAVQPGNAVIAVALDSSVWLEESTSVLGFSAFQRAETVLDVRAGVRLIPSTHNFFSADNQAFNSIGTASGIGGNISYQSSGFSRIRQGGLDPRLPIDGTAPNPLVAFSGTVGVAAATSLTATAPVFGAEDLSPPPVNYRYLNPTMQGSEYVVAITSGSGYKQTRRVAGNTTDSLTVESAWGVTPANGDTFEVYEIAGMPEVVNPAEEYTANWNNKAATADEGDNFGRQFRHIFILERLAADNSWDRAKQRQLNKDVAGLDGRGKIGRFLIPRLRQAVDGVGNGGNPNVDTVLAALEAHDGTPEFGRSFVDPVSATTAAGEVAFLNSVVNQLAADIYGDEFGGAVSVPGGSRALNLVQHAIDSAAGDVTGAYTQAYAGDYFNGADWRVRVRDSLSALATSGIPGDTARPSSTYRHPLRDAFLSLGLPDSAAMLEFEETPAGNRGTYEQIVDVGPVVTGEFIFPLGQSGAIQGSLAGVTAVDPHATSLHPVWRDWRFVPMLHVGQDLAGGGSGDADGDGILDAYERWYFGTLDRKARDDDDKDKGKLVDEFLAGTDPTAFDSDGDGIPDGRDRAGQDRLRSGIIKLKAKIKYGAGVGNDTLKLVVKLGAGAAELDPATRDVDITLSDDDEIYHLLIPAGTMTPNKAGTRFTYTDPAGTLSGLFKAKFAVGKPGRLATLKIQTVPTDLSNADKWDHDVRTMIEFTGAAHRIDPDVREYDFTGAVLRSK